MHLRSHYSWAKQVRETSPQIVIPGRAERESGIHNHHSGIWIPGLAHPGMTMERPESFRMSKGLIDLISILDIEPLEVNLFRGNSPKTSWQRVFGGQVIGQAMMAACRTVEGRLPHSQIGRASCRERV